MWKRYVQPIRSENFWRSTNSERVILPSSQAKLRKNALFIDQSVFSNFALYVIKATNATNTTNSLFREDPSLVFSIFTEARDQTYQGLSSLERPWERGWYVRTDVHDVMAISIHGLPWCSASSARKTPTVVSLLSIEEAMLLAN